MGDRSITAESSVSKQRSSYRTVVPKEMAAWLLLQDGDKLVWKGSEHEPGKAIITRKKTD